MSMPYLVAGHAAIDKLSLDRRCIVAQGDAMVLEGPWPWPSLVVARADDAAVEAARARIDGYLVDAIAEPGTGQALVVAAHRMLDVERFKPYAEQVGAIVERFGGRFLARAGKATMLGGDFVSERAVIVEFPTADDAVAFYVSDVYAPLMTLRHATTDPRFLIMARDGALPAAARAEAEKYLRSRPASAH
ncbi:MAG TPA: DUF1330 domain-containing protein [Xanthobacteraceae bacterium]|nr:DUF1330 domain-containing protein [Xanthobacteraceae bacterium]